MYSQQCSAGEATCGDLSMLDTNAPSGEGCITPADDDETSWSIGAQLPSEPEIM